MRASTAIIREALRNSGYRAIREESLPAGDRLTWWSDGMTTLFFQEYPGVTGAELYLPATRENSVAAVVAAIPEARHA